MSVKAMSLVWDMPCPDTINEIEFKPGHKYVLLAYADHADHHGKNIYPAVVTIAKKTGYEERSIQRLTHELEQMNVLLSDGTGPRGTNRFYLPFSAGGDKISPLTKFQGDKSSKSLGDIPSGDIPSGDKISPEFKELNLNNLIIDNNIEDIWIRVKNKLEEDMPRASFDTWVRDTEILGLEGKTKTIVIASRNSYARDWLTNRIKQKAQDISGLFVEFVVVAAETEA